MERPGTAVDEIAGVIEHMIVRGEVRAGEALPAERQLAAQLGVARLTLRQAIARLVARGLVVPRHGLGNIVLDVRRTATPAMLAHFTADGDLATLAEDLMAIRRGLARTVLERLAARKTIPARELAPLDDAIAQFAAMVARGVSTPADYADADHGVVAALVATSKLDVARLFLNPVFTALRELPALRDAIYADPADNVTRWRAVLAWLRTSPRRVEPLLAGLIAHDAGTVARLRKPARRRR